MASENPAAFPTTVQLEVMDDSAPNGYRTVRLPDGGMTLRDYFAAKALNGLILHYHEEMPIGPNPFTELSMVAYQYADAMLAERAKGDR